MATLPTGGPDLTGGVVYQQQPGLTWKIDQNNRRISGTTDDLEAVRQAVEVILHIERVRWQIYSPYTGVQFDGLIGEDPGYVAAELKRRGYDDSDFMHYYSQWYQSEKPQLLCSEMNALVERTLADLREKSLAVSEGIDE